MRRPRFDLTIPIRRIVIFAFIALVLSPNAGAMLLSLGTNTRRDEYFESKTGVGELGSRSLVGGPFREMQVAAQFIAGNSLHVHQVAEDTCGRDSPAKHRSPKIGRRIKFSMRSAIF